MDDLKRLKIIRRAQRAQATKTWNKAEALMEAETNEAGEPPKITSCSTNI